MSRTLYCAKCGQELLSIKKPVPSRRMVIEVVEPHTCSDKVADFDLRPATPKDPIEKESLFNKFGFVQKLNKGEQRAHFMPAHEPGDQRKPEHLREDANSAPTSVIDAILEKKNG